MGIRRALAMSMLVLFVLTPAVALGHAQLIESSPEAGSTITDPPLEITATFDEELVAEQSDMSLRNAAGDRIARGRVDPAEPRVLRMSPPPDLAPGEYEVRWVAGSEDGHIERGTYRFRLVPPTLPTVLPSVAPSPTPLPSGSPSPASSPSPSPLPSPSPSPAPSPSPTPGTAGADGSSVVVPIVAALLVLAALGLWLTRRRSR